MVSLSPDKPVNRRLAIALGTQIHFYGLPTIRPLSPDKRGCDRRIGPGGLAGGMSCMRLNDLGRYGTGSFPGYAEGLRRSENPRRTRRSPRSRGPE
jgi:hypothetical protein